MAKDERKSAGAGPTNSAQVRLYEAAVRLFTEKGGTQVTVSELAEAAGMARGTVYNNLDAPALLFESVATWLSLEMQERVESSFETGVDPAVRLANGVRYFLQRTHEEPHWGRFMCRFAFSSPSLHALWNSSPLRGVLQGVEQGRYKIGVEQVPSAIALMAGSVLGAMLLVLDGLRTWRDAGMDIAEMVLRALGIGQKEAHKLATAALPALSR